MCAGCGGSSGVCGIRYAVMGVGWIAAVSDWAPTDPADNAGTGERHNKVCSQSSQPDRRRRPGRPGGSSSAAPSWSLFSLPFQDFCKFCRLIFVPGRAAVTGRKLGRKLAESKINYN